MKILKILTKAFGFSLVETMVGVGLMAGVGLLVTQVAKQSNDVQKVAMQGKTSYDVFSIAQKNLRSKESCTKTLNGLTVPPNGKASVSRIYSLKNTAPVLEVGARFNSDGSTTPQGSIVSGLLVENMYIERRSTLSVFVMNIEVRQNAKVKNVKKEIDLTLEYDENNIVLNCDSNVANYQEEAVDGALNALCKGLNLIYDEDTLTCQAKAQFAPIQCQPSESIVAVDGGSGQYQFECRDSISINIVCDEHKFIRKNSDSSYSCVRVNCGFSIYQGLSGDNSSCLYCSGGEVLVGDDNGNFSCRSMNCTNGERFRGFRTNGQVVCESLVDGTQGNCPNGQLIVGADNVVRYECTTPMCTNTASYCANSTYMEGGFTCIGSKPADCSLAHENCAGDAYPSGNGCGACTGTKSPVNGNWENVTIPPETRPKPGVTCLEAPGGIPIEKKVARQCVNQACGGAPCVGDAIYWEESGYFQTCDAPPSGNSCVYLAGTASGPTVSCLYAVPGMEVERGACNTDSDCPNPYVKTPMECTQPMTFLRCGQPNYDGGGDLELPPPTTGGSGGGCFIAGTQVELFSGEKKNIEDILVGDELLDGSHKKVTVQKLLRIDHKGDIVSINGGGYFFTPNHPFLTTSGWKSLDPAMSNKESPGLNVTMLKLGDILVKRNGIELLMTLDRIPTDETVYNFELDGSHEYIADDYVVHNKYACPADPGCTGSQTRSCYTQYNPPGSGYASPTCNVCTCSDF